MGLPTGASQPARYTVVPFIGPDGVGKSSLVQALGNYVQRRDGLPVPPLRAVQGATVLDVRTARGFFQCVDFQSAEAEETLLRPSTFQGALLVVSASDGVLPGTVRSLQHARAAGIPRLAVALTKCDIVEDPEMLDLVEMEVRELLNKHEYDGDGHGHDAPFGRVAAFPAVRESERWMMALAQFFDGVQAWIV
jgi:Elongation factor Tu GTP binding domain